MKKEHVTLVQPVAVFPRSSGRTEELSSGENPMANTWGTKVVISRIVQSLITSFTTQKQSPLRFRFPTSSTS
jgi:hypothetical protein